MSDHKSAMKSLRKLDDNKALIRITSDYTQAQSELANDKERAERYNCIYEALDPPDEKIDESTGLIEDDQGLYSNTYLPIGAAIVDTATTHMFNLIFSTSNYMEIHSDDFKDGFYATEVTAHLMKRLKEMRYKHKVFIALQQASCFDYAVTGTRWLLEGGYVPKPQKRNEVIDLAGIKLERQRVFSEPVWVPDKIDRSDMFVLNYMRCYHDWTAVDGLNDSRSFIDDRDVLLEDLIENSDQSTPWGRYKNIDKVIKSVALNHKAEFEQYQDADPDVRNQYINSRKVKVIRYWTKDHMVEVAEGFIIRRVNMFDWAIRIWKVFEKNNKFEGMGFLQRLERNQYDINASLNSRRDLQNLISNPIGVIHEQLLADKDGDPTLHPGFLGTFRNGDAREKLWIYNPGQNTDMSTVGDVQAQVDMANKIAGVTEASQASLAKKRTSATEIRESAAGMLNRVDALAMRIEENCLEPTYLDLFFLEQVFLSKKESFKYNGEHGDQFFVIDPSSYMWNSQPRFTAKGTMNVIKDAVQVQQFMAMIDKAMQMPMVQHDWQKIAVQMWRYAHPKNYHEFVKDPTIPQENIPAHVENALIAQGIHIRVSPANDHNAHLEKHEAIKATPDYQVWNKNMKLHLDMHIADHKKSMMAGMAGQQTNRPMQDPSDILRGIRPGSVPNV